MTAALAKAKAKAKVDAEKAVVRNADQLLQLLRLRASTLEANGQLAFKRFAKNAQVPGTHTTSYTLHTHATSYTPHTRTTSYTPHTHTT